MVLSHSAQTNDGWGLWGGRLHKLTGLVHEGDSRTPGPQPSLLSTTKATITALFESSVTGLGDKPSPGGALLLTVWSTDHQSHLGAFGVAES